MGYGGRGGKEIFFEHELYINDHGVGSSDLLEAKHAIWTSIKVFVVRFDTFKERGEIVVGITEIVQFDDFRTISR